jgi:septal ring factor EnvC (AmiA/AmiB activator)
MSTVNSSSQYYTRLLEKLNAQETDIETIQADVRTLDKKLDEQRQELENYLANLSIE